MKKISLLLFMSLCAVLFACTKKLPTKDFVITRADSVQIPVRAEIASTPEQRNFGFMERKHIPDGTGMLFVFERDRILSFYMKNTPHPLSIAYIDSKGVIRNMFDMEPFNLSPIDSTVSVRYALEVPQGWFAKNDIRLGDRINVELLD